MKNYSRNQEKIKFSTELEEAFEFLREMKWLELFSCTEYQAARRELKESSIEWFRDWQDVSVALHGTTETEHVCTCFKNFYPIIVKRYPSFEKEIWRF